MKMGNIVPRTGSEPTSHAFQASVLTITPHSLLDVTTLSTPTCLCGSLPLRSVQITTVPKYNLQPNIKRFFRSIYVHNFKSNMVGLKKKNMHKNVILKCAVPDWFITIWPISHWAVCFILIGNETPYLRMTLFQAPEVGEAKSGTVCSSLRAELSHVS